MTGPDAPATSADRRVFVLVIGLIVVVAVAAAVVLALNGASAGVEAVGAIGSFALGALSGQARR